MEDEAVLEFSNPQNLHYTLEVYNVFGEKLKTVNNISINIVALKEHDFGSGIFFYSLTNNKLRDSKLIGKFIVR